ncbi:hypothetical protein DFH06DRAFT_1308442 [Mycena polygramma]|nr:hypothetical protein DFH06DRAFT_1308442 [Mycena polygramma]
MFPRIAVRRFCRPLDSSSLLCSTMGSHSHPTVCRVPSQPLAALSSQPVAQSPIRAAMRAIHPPLRNQGDLDWVVAERCKNWHTTKVTLPYGWSMDWTRWKTIKQFLITPGWYDLSLVDVMFKDHYKIEGVMLPLAFLDCPDFYFMFFAGGKHYLYDDMLGLFEFLDEFPTHDDFLRRYQSSRHVIPDGWNETYARINHEQRSLLEALNGVKVNRKWK